MRPRHNRPRATRALILVDPEWLDGIGPSGTEVTESRPDLGLGRPEFHAVDGAGSFVYKEPVGVRLVRAATADPRDDYAEREQWRPYSTRP